MNLQDFSNWWKSSKFSQAHRPAYAYKIAFDAWNAALAITINDYAELAWLKEAVKGPDGFATWQDAAVAERIKRVAAERELAAWKEQKPIAYCIFGISDGRIYPHEVKLISKDDIDNEWKIDDASMDWYWAGNEPLYKAPKRVVEASKPITQPTGWICPSCGVDRLKTSCPRTSGCPMVATAYNESKE